MSARRDESVCCPSRNPFAVADRLLVGPGFPFACSGEGMDNEASTIEAHVCPCDRSNSACVSDKLVLPVHCVCDFIGDGAGGADSSVQSAFIPNCVGELREKCCFNCQGLVHLGFGASSRLACIGSGVFSRTQVESVSLPDSVVEIGSECFYKCSRLRSLTFGVSSQLERIGCSAFMCTGIKSVSIPDSVVELGDECFDDTKSLHYLKFGGSSKLERVGCCAFRFTSIESVSIPDSVVELGEQCFSRIISLRYLAFGGSSKLERIGVECFSFTSVESVTIPSSVVCLCDRCFYKCESLVRVAFGESSNLESIGADAFSFTGLMSLSIPDSVVELCRNCFSDYNWFSVTFSSSSNVARILGSSVCGWQFDMRRCYDSPRRGIFICEICIPDSVVELGDRCFYKCESLQRVLFGPLSNLQRIGYFCFSHSVVESISVPDSVIELDRCCFYMCRLRHLTFGASSKLEHIHYGAFLETCVESVSIPDSVVDLGDKCFCNCISLRCVAFGASSTLQRISAEAFLGTSIESVSIPDSVVDLGDKCFDQCEELRHVTLGLLSNLERIGDFCFARSCLASFRFPCSVVRVGGGVFNPCCVNCEVSCSDSSWLLVRDFLLFDRFSRVCSGCVCLVRDVSIPSSASFVQSPFVGCLLNRLPFHPVLFVFAPSAFINASLVHLAFGASSNLESVDADAFSFTGTARLRPPFGTPKSTSHEDFTFTRANTKQQAISNSSTVFLTREPNETDIPQRPRALHLPNRCSALSNDSNAFTNARGDISVTGPAKTNVAKSISHGKKLHSDGVREKITTRSSFTSNGLTMDSICDFESIASLKALGTSAL